MPNFAESTFTGSDGVEVSTVDYNLVKHGSSAGDCLLTSNRGRPTSTGSNCLYYHAGIPASADYDGIGSVYYAAWNSVRQVAVYARLSTSSHTGYRCYFQGDLDAWRLQKVVNGSVTNLGSAASETFGSAGTTVEMKVRCVGTTISAFKKGASTAWTSASDSAISAAGKTGFFVSGSSASEGFQIDTLTGYEESTTTTYTEPLTAVLASVTSIDDRQTYQEAAAALIQAGASADAVVTMMEQVVALGQTETAATGLITLAEQTLATIQSAVTLADAVTAAEALAATVISQTAVTDSQTSQGAEDLLVTAQGATSITDVVTAVEALLTTIQSETGVTDSSGGSPQTYPETLLVTATVAAEAGAAQSMVEGLTVVAQGDVSVVDFRGYLEQIAATAQAIATVADRHLMIDNVAIMALSGASLGEISAYLEQVLVTAQAQASLADVLVTQFVGRYLFLDTLPLRSFTDRLPARSFTDTVRGRA